MKRLLMLTVLGVCVNPALIQAEIVYDFDDGTFQGWDYLLPDGSAFPVEESESGWIPSDEEIDIGDGFTLLPATSGEFRVVPDPWESRDCIGRFCLTQILRSPSFFLDGSGDLTIDMIGGGALSNNPISPDAELPEQPEDFPEEKGIEFTYQGFALLDVEAQTYVAFGFSSGENDGKARPTDPPTRADWETVSIPQEELEPFANDGKEYQVEIFDSYSGGWGWIGFDTVRIPGSSEMGDGTPGDYNGNGTLDADDIDTLTAAVNGDSTESQFDLDENGLVNNDDRLFWVETLKNTYLGDSNLDGEFNSGDLVATFTLGQYEDGVPGNSTWASGDWNGDTEFDSSDFVAAFSAGGYEQGPRAATAAVPEPSSLAATLLAMLAVVAGVRDRR